MKAIKIFLLTSLLVFLPVILSAQTVSGKLVDEKNKPLPFANVVLLSLPDSAFVSGTISGEDGSFTLEVTSENQIVKISSIGYKTVCKPVSPANIGIVQLVSDAQMLGEVVVKGDLPKTRVKGDAMVTEVKNSKLSYAGTANDVLRKLPGVVDVGNGLQVLGRGTPEYYINGRKVRDLSELDQLSSTSIRNVEVVMNPGARYDASVKAVIRINTQKPAGEGFGFDNRLMGDYNKKAGWLDQFNFNYRKNNFDLFGLLFYSDSYYWKTHQAVQDTYLDKHWKQESLTDVESRSRTFTGRLGMNYVFNNNHSLGAYYRISRQPYYKNYMDVYTDVFSDGTDYESSDNSSLGFNDYTKHTLDLYYNGNLGNWRMEVDGNAIWQTTDADNLANEQINAMDGTNSVRNVTTYSDTEYEFYAAKVVLSRPLWGGNFSVGAEYGYMNRSMDYRNPEGIISDSKDEINENNASAYAEYSKAFGKVNAQLGIRYEYDDFDYYVNDEHQKDQSKVYHNVFPSASLFFPLGKTQVMLQYRSEIQRPRYSQLSSQVAYINRYTYEGGNPLLRPVMTNSLNLGVSYRWLSGRAGYQHVKDDIFNTSYPYSSEDPTIALISQNNSPAYDMLFVAITAAPTIGKWSPSWTASLNKQWLEVESHEGYINLNKPLFMLNWDNSLELPMGFLLNMGVRWMSTGDMQNTRLDEQSWSVNGSLHKSIMNGRMSFLLQASDIFNTQKQYGTLYSGEVRTIKMYNDPNARSVSLTVRYKFNTTRSKYKGTGAGDSQKSRM